MKCSFCKSDFDIPYGVTIVQKDGSLKQYCSSKCRKNAEMGRDNRRVKWVTKLTHNKAKAEEKKAEKEARENKKEEKPKTEKKAKKPKEKTLEKLEKEVKKEIEKIAINDKEEVNEEKDEF